MRLRKFETVMILSFGDGETRERSVSRHFFARTGRWKLWMHYPRLDVWAWWNVMHPDLAISDVKFDVRRREP